jgi:hypothetical protein
MSVKSFIVQAPGVCTIKHYGLVMYGFCNKLVCLSIVSEVTHNSNNTLAYYIIYPFAVHYKSIMFHSTYLRGLYCKSLSAVNLYSITVG